MEKKKVAIILYQYSIVVKGIERKLKELGYNVTTIEPDFKLIKECAAQTDLFVVYLPKDNKDREDDRAKLESLTQICDTLKANGKNMVVIGEKDYRNGLLEGHPIQEDYDWLNRPVDMNLLAATVKKALAGERDSDTKKQILIVDDDPSYAGMVRAWIKGTYKVDVLTSGKQTFSFVIKKKVNLILLDYEMPIMNGPEVLQMLRRELTPESIPPIVFLTGVSTPEEVKKVLALKPDGYILKSTTREQLLEYLAEKLQ